jgi:hypothetical protein
VPRQDAQGRWISDDGLFYWDGATWRPLGVQGSPVPAPYGAQAPRKRAVWPMVLIGCAFVALVVLVIGIAFTVFVFSNADFQHAFCNGWANSSSNLACPFAKASPTT